MAFDSAATGCDEFLAGKLGGRWAEGAARRARLHAHNKWHTTTLWLHDDDLKGAQTAGWLPQCPDSCLFTFDRAIGRYRFMPRLLAINNRWFDYSVQVVKRGCFKRCQNLSDVYFDDYFRPVSFFLLMTLHLNRVNGTSKLIILSVISIGGKMSRLRLLNAWRSYR